MNPTVNRIGGERPFGGAAKQDLYGAGAVIRPKRSIDPRPIRRGGAVSGLSAAPHACRRYSRNQAFMQCAVNSWGVCEFLAKRYLHRPRCMSCGIVEMNLTYKFPTPFRDRCSRRARRESAHTYQKDQKPRRI